MGRNEQSLVRWIASHTRYETYDYEHVERSDIEQINAIIRHFNAIIHEAKYIKENYGL